MISRLVDLVSLIGGLGLILNDVMIETHVHAMILVLGFALIGLPTIWRPPGQEIEPAKPKRINRNTDLRIAQRLPDTPMERKIRKELKRLEAYDKSC